MAALGDRTVASLLSALAEAPDAAAAASYLLSQLMEQTGAPAGVVLRIDATQEQLAPLASSGVDVGDVMLPLTDITNALVVSALSLTPVRGRAPLRVRELRSFERWTALPLSQPRQRGVPERISEHRAAELLPADRELLTGVERRFGAAPAGVILLQGEHERDLVLECADLVSLASHVLARLA